MTSPAGLAERKRTPSGARRTPAGIADKRVTTIYSGQSSEALPRSTNAASVAGRGQGAARGSHPGVEKAPQRDKASAPQSPVSPNASAAGGQSEPTKATQWPETEAACRQGERPGHSDNELRLGRRALSGQASLGWTGAGGTLKRTTKPMEGSSGRTLATATCHDGLVSGAKPLSRLLREVSTSPDVGPLRWVRTQQDGGSVVSAAELERSPSGSRSGFVSIVGSRAGSW